MVAGSWLRARRVGSLRVREEAPLVEEEGQGSEQRNEWMVDDKPAPNRGG